MAPPAPAPSTDRNRVAIDLAPSVSALLEHVAAVTGVPKSQILLQSFLEALPALLERADGISKRQQQVHQGKGAKR